MPATRPIIPLDNSRYNIHYWIVSGKLGSEIKQSRPFASVEEEAILNIHRTADYLARRTEALLKTQSLSLTQYNVLRILRGAEPDGLPCREIAARLITRDPDTTRLLDRLEKRHLIERRRGTDDRRVVTTRITRDGLKLLKDLDEPVRRATRELIAHVGANKLQDLIETLEVIRKDDA